MSENKAAALIDDGSLVTVGGNLTVNSQAEDNFRVSATASAGDGTLGSVGGAVAFNKVGNQATAFIGYNATVDVEHQTNITANARVPDGLAPFDPTIDLSTVGTGTAQDVLRIGEQFSDGNETAAALASALASLATYLTGILADPNGAGTTFVHAGG